MEAGTNLAKLGLPVSNVVRIRPLLPDEPRAGEIRITDNQRKIVLAEPGKLQGTADDEYYADYCYAEGDFMDIYERSIAPLIRSDASGFPGFVDGVNCAILAFGDSRSGKTYTVEGSGKGGEQHDGVVPAVIRGVFQGLQAKLNDQAQGGRFGARGSSRRW
jgi:kinesin family protein 11